MYSTTQLGQLEQDPLNNIWIWLSFTYMHLHRLHAAQNLQGDLPITTEI